MFLGLILGRKPWLTHFDHIYPPLYIHRWKAVDLGFHLAISYRDLKHPTSRKNFTAVLGQNHALIHTQCLNLLKCSFFIWDLPWLNGGPTASDCFQISDEIGSRQSNLSQNVVSYQRDLMAGRLRVVVCSRCVALRCVEHYNAVKPDAG